jgi:hypothetical protein
VACTPPAKTKRLAAPPVGLKDVIVQIDAALPPGAFAGDDPRTDDEARRILDHLRVFVDADTINGKDGIAWAWSAHLITVADLRDVYARDLKLREMVGRIKPTEH